MEYVEFRLPSIEEAITLSVKPKKVVAESPFSIPKRTKEQVKKDFEKLFLLPKETNRIMEKIGNTKAGVRGGVLLFFLGQLKLKFEEHGIPFALSFYEPMMEDSEQEKVLRNFSTVVFYAGFEGIFIDDDKIFINENIINEYLIPNIGNLKRFVQNIHFLVTEYVNKKGSIAEKIKENFVEHIDNKQLEVKEIKKNLLALENEISYFSMLKERFETQNFISTLLKVFPDYLFNYDSEKNEVVILTPRIEFNDNGRILHGGRYILRVSFKDKTLKAKAVEKPEHWPTEHPHLDRAGSPCYGSVFDSLAYARAKFLKEPDISPKKFVTSGGKYLRGLIERGYYVKAVKYAIMWVNEYNHSGSWWNGGHDVSIHTCDICGGTHLTTNCPQYNSRCPHCSKSVPTMELQFHIEEYHEDIVSDDLDDEKTDIEVVSSSILTEEEFGDMEPSLDEDEDDE